MGYCYVEPPSISQEPIALEPVGMAPQQAAPGFQGLAFHGIKSFGIRGESLKVMVSGLGVAGVWRFLGLKAVLVLGPRV